MAGIGVENGLARKALIRSKSVSTRRTASSCSQPRLFQYYLELGEISSYPPGYKENAGHLLPQ